MQTYKRLILIMALMMVSALAFIGPCAAQLTPVDLGVLEGLDNSVAVAVNASGQVVGYCYAGNAMKAFIWQNGVGMTELEPLSGYPNSRATDINDAGQVVGYSSMADTGNGEACLWQWNSVSNKYEVTGLGFLRSTDTDSWADAINNNGQIIGASTDDDVDEDGSCCNGFIWENGVMSPVLPGMDHYAGDPFFYADYINESGQLAGYIWYCDCTKSDPAGFWDKGELTSINPAYDGYAYGLNNHGEVIGHTNSESGSMAFFWLPQAAYGLEAGLHATPTAIDNYTFGYSQINDAGKIAKIYRPSNTGNSKIEVVSLADLNTPISTMETPYWIRSTQMNAAGGISGFLDSTLLYPSTSSGQSEYWGYYHSADTGLLYLGSLLGPGPDVRGSVYQMNDSGLMVGESPAISADPYLCQCPTWRATLWDASQSLVHAPILGQPTTPMSAIIGLPVSFTASAADPDDDTLAYSLTGAPSEAGINATTGVFSWTPASDGYITFAVTATDPAGNWDSKFVQINIGFGNPPVLNSLTTPLYYILGSAVGFTASATDADAGDTLIYSLVGAPSGASINPATGVFSWTPTAAGTYDFTVRVTDAAGNTDSQALTVYVSAIPITNITLTRNRKGVVVCTFTAANPHATAVDSVTVTTATIGAISSSSLPVKLRTIRVGASKTDKMQFSGVAAGAATLTMQGTSSLGAFYKSQSVTVP